jgi:hypothetical protein
LVVTYVASTSYSKSDMCNDPILGFYLFNCLIYYLIGWCVILVGYLVFRDIKGILVLLGMESYFMRIVVT